MNLTLWITAPRTAGVWLHVFKSIIKNVVVVCSFSWKPLLAIDQGAVTLYGWEDACISLTGIREQNTKSVLDKYTKAQNLEDNLRSILWTADAMFMYKVKWEAPVSVFIQCLFF